MALHRRCCTCWLTRRFVRAATCIWTGLVATCWKISSGGCVRACTRAYVVCPAVCLSVSVCLTLPWALFALPKSFALSLFCVTHSRSLALAFAVARAHTHFSKLSGMLTRFRRNVTYAQALDAIHKAHAMLRLSVHEGIKYVFEFEAVAGCWSPNSSRCA